MFDSSAPAAAWKFTTGEFTLGDNGESAKSAPITLTALSGEVLDHWYFGPIIHDMGGMTHPSRIPMDYCHDPKDIIGYVNRFTTGDTLVLNGALTPFKESDRATEIMHKLREGVPYQASIDFTPTTPNEIEIEEVAEGETAMVNGREMTGPLAVVRKWKLSGVAICPHGADSGTATYLQAKQKLEENTIMSEEKSVEVKEVQAPVEAETGTSVDASNDASEKEPQRVMTQEEEEPKNVRELTRDDFMSYCETYGVEKGADYFKQGLTPEQAQQAFVEALRAENAELKETLSKRDVPGHSPERASGLSLSKVSEDFLTETAKRYGVSADELRRQFTKKGQ